MAKKRKRQPVPPHPSIDTWHRVRAIPFGHRIIVTVKQLRSEPGAEGEYRAMIAAWLHLSGVLYDAGQDLLAMAKAYMDDPTGDRLG